MNCEQVEELLSAYLDDSLAVGEEGAESAQHSRQAITAHLAGCIYCSTALADFRRFDTLLAHLPRISPQPALRDKIFSSPEYLELTGTYNASSEDVDTRPYGSVRRHVTGRPPAGRPQLVALPGGRRSSFNAHTTKPQASPPPPLKRRNSWGLRVMHIAIAAALFLTIGVGSLIGWNLWLQNHLPLSNSGVITPPAGIDQHAPLSAGRRFIFLRGGALWSVPADGIDGPAQRLTPANVTVAANWTISPPLPGHTAGDMIAYIDLQRAQVHTIRSDGQRDTEIAQPLLKSGVAPTSVWETGTGEAILHSLAWSKDGGMLAFVADPSSIGSTNLDILTLATGTLATVPLPMRGNVSAPVWSPDGIRLAFALTHGGLVSIMDYNTQNNGLLVTSVNSPAHANDTLLTLDWSPNISAPAITWSVGDMNAVHSIWIHRVGTGATAAPQLLLNGQYPQAIYSRNGHGGIGSWLLESIGAGNTVNLLRIDVTPGALPLTLTSNKHIGVAQWSPDGTQVDYLDGLTADIGTLHVVNVTTFVDRTLAHAVANEPAPAWSADGQHLAFSTGTQVVVVNLQSGRKLEHIQLHGTASTFLWSTTVPWQLVVAFSNGQQQGTFLVDTRHNTSHQVDQRGIDGPMLWTEVP